jgi:hypothetical protein
MTAESGAFICHLEREPMREAYHIGPLRSRRLPGFRSTLFVYLILWYNRQSGLFCSLLYE